MYLLRLIQFLWLLSLGFTLAQLYFQQANLKICHLKGRYLERNIWNHWTGFYCYYYTNKIRFKFKYTTTQKPIFLNGKKYFIRVTLIDKNTYFWYDYTNKTSLEWIQKSFKNKEYLDLWINCCEKAVDCCDNFMNSTNIFPTQNHPCPAIWDAWSCFPPTKANTIEKVVCSDQAYSANASICELQSEKECFTNGTWNDETNYKVCAIAPVLRNRHNFHIIFLMVASLISLPSVIIFLTFRNLRKNTKLILHRNLLLVIIIRNILTISSKKLVILDALVYDSNHVMENNGIACRVLAFFENVSKNGIYACMLVDGFYLHKLIVRVFANEPKLEVLYALVVVLSFLPALIWASLRSVHQARSCWMVDNDGDQWASDAVRMAIVVVNALLLIDIIRVMILKLKHQSTSQQARATFRATLFLIPLFGIYIIVIANRNIVSSNTCQAENVYFYVSYSLEGLQGVMVAILFCYLSSEVHVEIKNAFRKLWINLLKNTETRRRTTAATYIGRNSAENTCNN